MTPETIQSKRIAAAERYSAAVSELHESMVDLAALDGIANANSFGSWPDVVGLRHPLVQNIHGHWASEVGPRREALAKSQ